MNSQGFRSTESHHCKILMSQRIRGDSLTEIADMVRAKIETAARYIDWLSAMLN